MSSRKRSSLRRRSRARSQAKLTRNGVMNIVIPVAVAGVGVAAYLIWKKSRASASVARSANVEAPVDLPSAPFTPSLLSAKEAANAAFLASKDSVYSGPALPAKPALNGIGSYYDVSAAGAPYQGMFGVDGLGGDGAVAMSTITPLDVARRARDFAWVRPVTRPFAGNTRTGGVFARDLFTGMTS
jgi:hypothetical protein